MAVAKGVKKARVSKLLNVEPNPFQDINTFKRNCVIDFLLEGNIFIYFDGVHMYHLPANKVTIEGSPTTYIKNYTYNTEVKYKPSEIIHVKENSYYSIYRGCPRVKSALRSMQLLDAMRTFQDNFFKNDAVPGLVIKSPNTLSPKIKERLLASWVAKYNPKSGGRRPMILDGGLEVDSLSEVDFRELDFKEGVATAEKTILKALGIPPIIMDSGNNANISPNLRMYYLETIVPIVRKINFAFERYFGFKITEDLTGITAMQPDLREQSAYYSTLVNGGVITPNEAREKLGYDPVEGHDDLRIPANIAGSAGDPSEGGRQTEDEE